MEQIWNVNKKRLSRFCLKCHVLLLAGVFEKSINNCLKNYGLSKSHYRLLSAPALSLDAIPNMTKAELDLTINIWNFLTQNKNQNIYT